MARLKALEYMDQGNEYLNQYNKSDNKHQGIKIVEVELFGPVIIVPEGITILEGMETVVINLGTIKASSSLAIYDKDTNYKEVYDPDDLYDEYSLDFQDFQVIMIEELERYEKWKETDQRIDIIRKIAISVNASRCVEPEHPNYTWLSLLVRITEIDIFVSDYIVANLLNIISNFDELEGMSSEDVKRNNEVTRKMLKGDEETSSKNTITESSESNEGEESEESNQSEDEANYSESTETVSYSRIEESKRVLSTSQSETPMSSQEPSNYAQESSENYEGGSGTYEMSSDEASVSESHDQAETSQVGTSNVESSIVASSQMEYSQVQSTPNSTEEVVSYTNNESEESETENSHTDGSQTYTDSDESDNSMLSYKKKENLASGLLKERSPYIQEANNVNIRSKAEVEESQLSIRKMHRDKEDSKKKVDQKIIVEFHHMRIIVGESVPKNTKNPVYRDNIPPERKNIPHIDILELILEDLDVRVDIIKQNMDVCVKMSRIYIQDLQKIKVSWYL